jgi:hypothetical protein
MRACDVTRRQHQFMATGDFNFVHFTPFPRDITRVPVGEAVVSIVIFNRSSNDEHVHDL